MEMNIFCCKGLATVYVQATCDASEKVFRQIGQDLYMIEEFGRTQTREF